MDGSVEETRGRYVKIAETMITQWERAEREGLSRHFAAPLLRDILFMEESYRSEWSSKLPWQWFEYVLGEEADPGMRRKLLYLMKKYVETFQTTNIVASANEPFGRERSIYLYRRLRKRSEVPAPFKELLTATYIGRLYYERRDYRLVERLLAAALPAVQNDLYLDELQHLRLLCLKNQFKHKELEQELKRQLNGQVKPKSLIRKGYFYLALGHFEEAVDAYYRAVLQTENQEVAFHALFALQQLRRMRVKGEELARTLDSLHLDNTEEQLKTRFGETSRLVDLKSVLSEHERLAIRCIGDRERTKDRRQRKNSWGSDNYMLEAYGALVQNAELIEHNGLPDFMIAYNSAMRLVVEQLILEGQLQLAQRYLGFGLNFKDLSLTDHELFLYRDKRSGLFRWMNGKLLQIVSMLEDRSGKTDTSYFLLVNAADALLSQTNLLYSIINPEWIEPLVNPLTRILRLRIPAINNSVHPSANKLLVRVINNLPPVRSVEVFEGYLRHLLSTAYLDHYSELDGIRFVGWSPSTLQSFHYGLLTDIFRRMLDRGAFQPRQYYFLILNLHGIAPLPDPLLAELKPLLRQLDEKAKGGSENEQDALSRVLAELNVLSEVEIRGRILAALEQYEQNDRMGSDLGGPLCFLAETVGFLSEEEVDRIINKARSDKTRLAQAHHGLVLMDLEVLFDECYQYFLLQLARHHGSPDLFIREFGMERVSRIPFHHLSQARQSFEASEQLIDSMNEWLGDRIVKSNEQERSNLLRMARSWMETGSTLYLSDRALAGKIEWFIWDSSYQVKAWAISFMTVYLSQGSVPDGEGALDFFEKIKDLPIEENHESFMLAMAFFLKRFNQNLLVKDNSREDAEKWIGVIKHSPYRSVQLEWEMTHNHEKAGE